MVKKKGYKKKLCKNIILNFKMKSALAVHIYDTNKRVMSCHRQTAIEYKNCKHFNMLQVN